MNDKNPQWSQKWLYTILLIDNNYQIQGDIYYFDLLWNVSASYILSAPAYT